MKKFLVFLCAMFVCAAFAETKNITWSVDGTTYATSTCEVGNDLIIPQTNPTKYGYHFIGWENSYIFLEYIESTGTQYINTGTYYATTDGDLKIIADMEFNSTNNYSFLGIYGGFYFGVASNKWFFSAYNTNVDSDTNRHIFTYERTTSNLASLDIDGNKYGKAGATGSPGNVFLFNLSTGDYGGSGQKIYNAKIFIDNALLGNLIPAKRTSDNAIGMYDTVSQTFFTNAGTGEFIAGPVKQ